MTTAFETLAAAIDLSQKLEGETDYGTCRRQVAEYFDNAEINEMCRELEIRVNLPRYKKVIKIVETVLDFDRDGGLLSESDVQTTSIQWPQEVTVQESDFDPFEDED